MRGSVCVKGGRSKRLGARKALGQVWISTKRHATTFAAPVARVSADDPVGWLPWQAPGDMMSTSKEEQGPLVTSANEFLADVQARGQILDQCCEIRYCILTDVFGPAQQGGCDGRIAGLGGPPE
jgi:hypothetical protein